MNRGAKTGEQGPATEYGPTKFCLKKQQVSEYSKSGGLANFTLKEESHMNEERDAARELIEEAITMANDAGLFCTACVQKVNAGHRPVDFCSTCDSVHRLWLESIVERVWRQAAAEQPGRFTIWKEGETTWVKRNW